MKLDQRYGPFTKNETIIFNKKNVNYFQLGIEYPHSIPISELDNLSDDNWQIIIHISQDPNDNSPEKDYVITTKDILELKPNGVRQMAVKIKKGYNNPYLIINAAYEDAN
jgi:hypothetical protein